jgi:hypothetical protein
MGKLRRATPQGGSSLPEVVISTTWAASSGRILAPGMELSIVGERGRFKFIKHVISGGREWIDVLGGRNGHEKIRSFRPDRVATVHRLKKLR